MKLLLLLIIMPVMATAQYNCSIYKDSSHARACRICNYAGDSLPQGSPQCEHWLDSAIATCPDFAPAWHEKSVPYLKRGDFVTWRRMLDKSVDLDPRQFLPYRGWCRFEFLRDYAGAIKDLQRFDTLSELSHTSSNDGDYELHLIMALCERELGDTTKALHYFGVAMDKDSTNAGLYGYLHLGVTKLGMHDYPGAIAALEHENRVYEQFADTWYAGCISPPVSGRWPKKCSSTQRNCSTTTPAAITSTALIAKSSIRSMNRTSTRPYLINTTVPCLANAPPAGQVICTK
jgi:hypothetical protein